MANKSDKDDFMDGNAQIKTKEHPDFYQNC